MNYLLTTIVAATLSFTSWAISAEPVDSKQSVQTQKDNLPDTTKTGDYLETQPSNVGETETSTEENRSAKKLTNMKRSKSITEEPADGGVDLKK